LKINKKNTPIVIFITLLIISSIISIYIFNISNENTVAMIYQNQKLVKTIDLSLVESPYSFILKNNSGGENTIYVEKNKICVSSSNCKDKICVNQGFISDGVVPIVCLPNKVVIKIEKKGNDLADIATK